MSSLQSKFKDIMYEYDDRRRSNEMAALERRNQLYKEHPEYKALDDEISDLAVSQSRILVSSDRDAARKALSDYHDRLACISDQKKTLLSKWGLASDYLEVTYDCPDCRDTGFIGDKKCHCLTQRIVRQLYSQSNLQDRLEKENFTFFTDEYYNDSEKGQISKIYDGCKRFIENFDNSFANILFFGTVGSGKTFFSNCISKELLDSGHSVIYFTSYQLFNYIADRVFNREVDGEIFLQLEDLYDCDLLVIDDLGAENPNSFTVSQFFLILNERLNRRKSTIISSNLTPQQMNEAYTERSLSRILGSYSLYRFTGRDMRSLIRAGRS